MQTLDLGPSGMRIVSQRPLEPMSRCLHALAVNGR